MVYHTPTPIPTVRCHYFGVILTHHNRCTCMYLFDNARIRVQNASLINPVTINIRGEQGFFVGFHAHVFDTMSVYGHCWRWQV